MNKIALFAISTIFVFISIQSCVHTPDQIIPQPIDTTKTDTLIKRPCSSDSVYYATDIQPLFNLYCVGSGCHNLPNPADNINLSSLSTAMASGKIKPYNSANSKVYLSLIDTDPNNRMPPSGNLPLDKIALIKKWIDQGAKDLWCDDMKGPCDTSKVLYSATIKSIFSTHCNGCHGYSGGVTLTTYFGVKTVVNNGKLWNSVNHLSGITKAMPSSTTKLSACNLRQLKIWIDAGALNN